MSSLERCVLANPPIAPKMKHLSAIYAAEDARRAASNSLPKIPEKFSFTASYTEAEPMDFEKISSSFGSKENDPNTGKRGVYEVSLKDFRASCRAAKKRKAGAKSKEADDLDEPLIILKAKRSNSSHTMKSKSKVTSSIQRSLEQLEGSKGLAEEDPRGSEKTLSPQTDSNATPSSNHVNSPNAGTLGLIYHVNTEPQYEMDITNKSFSSDSEPLLDVDPIDIAIFEVNFVVKSNFSCDPSSNLICSTSGNTQCRKNLMRSFNNARTNIVESEENFYSPQDGQNNFPESEFKDVEVDASPLALTWKAPDSKSQNNLHESVFIDVEVRASPLALTWNAPDSKSPTCSFNEACIDGQSEENWYSPENSQGSLHEDRITEVEGDASPANINGQLPTDENPICSLKKACTNDVESGKNQYPPQSSKSNSLESEIMEVQAAPASAVALSENMQGGKELILSCNETCIGDVESESSQKNLHESEIAEVESEATLVNENSLNGDNVTSSFNEACIKDVNNEENFYWPESSQNNSQESENAELDSGKSAVKVTGGVIVDPQVNTHTENGSNDYHGFLCEEAPIFHGSSDRSSEGQLESIVYSAISTPNCLYKNEDDTPTSVHGTLSSSTENSETDNTYRNGVVTNTCEVFKGSNPVQSADVFKTENTGVLQLCDNLEKVQSIITDNRGPELEKEVKGDPRSISERPPMKLLSNRTIISPTSQEKLCQALTSIDLCVGAEISKCKKKILFENCTRLKKCVTTTQSTERNFQKLRGVIKKGNLKSTRAACMKGSPVKMDTEKTVEFLRRQMHDFENITTKLLKNMRFAKSVMDETLAVQSPLPPKFSAEEIKAASENASELEKTTTKWLSIMSKDCNRFCKILRSADNSASSPPVSNSGDQKRRKIVFADEVGGVLCHTRVFSETLSPPTAAEN